MNGTIVVTGAARGIGRAIAEKMAATGPLNVVGVDVAPELALSESITPVQIDLTSVDGPGVVREAVEAAGAPLVGLVNNAGITRDARLVNMADDDFAAVLEVNLGAAFRLTTELAPLMSDGGSVVNIASRAYLGNFGQFNYSMSKGGLVGMTRALALELAPRVRVNAIAPSLTASEMTRAMPAKVLDKMIASIPLGRQAEPEEIAETIAALASPATAYVTGEVVVACGGRSLAP